MKNPEIQNPHVIAVVGGQWGDEGKGKLVDFFAKDADVVIRAQGGDNAGHTVINRQGEFALHLVPAGIFNRKTINIIGAGVALNPKSLISEIEKLNDKSVSTEKLYISTKAHLAFDYHLFIDLLQEVSRENDKIETTKRGIGPTYMDKAKRAGVRAYTLKNPDLLLLELQKILQEKSSVYSYDSLPEQVKIKLQKITKENYFSIKYEDFPYLFKTEYYEDFIKKASYLLSYMVTDTDDIVQKELRKGSTIVLEGAHGTLLDLDHGTYPMVTSSNPTAAGLAQGSGIPPTALTKIVGVFKAYQTRVGSGGMPTELKNDKGALIRHKGNEYGTTTGRPRRTGYFDGVAARYADEINWFTDIAITRLDILTGVGDLKICNNYLYEGRILERFQTENNILSKCQPVYSKVFPNWNQELVSSKNYTDSKFDMLPKEAQDYLLSLMNFFYRARLSYIGTGGERSAMICL